MSSNSKHSMSRTDTIQKADGRRAFLKKIVYATPSIVVLGQLVGSKAIADDFGPPPSDASSTESFE